MTIGAYYIMKFMKSNLNTYLNYNIKYFEKNIVYKGCVSCVYNLILALNKCQLNQYYLFISMLNITLQYSKIPTTYIIHEGVLIMFRYNDNNLYEV